MLRGTQYQFSGILDKSALALPLLAVLLGVGCGYLHGYLEYKGVDWGWTDKLGIGSGLVLIIIISASLTGLAKETHCRNPKFMRVVGACCGLIFLYTAWASFTYGLPTNFRPPEYAEGFVSWFLSPVEVFKTAKWVGEYGWYFNSDGSGRTTPMVAGPRMYVRWVAEAAVVMFWLSLRASDFVISIYCEACQKWCVTDKDWATFDCSMIPVGHAQDRIESAVKLGDLDVIAELERKDPAYNPASKQVRIECERCLECNLLGTYKTVFECVSAKTHTMAPKVNSERIMFNEEIRNQLEKVKWVSASSESSETETPAEAEAQPQPKKVRLVNPSKIVRESLNPNSVKISPHIKRRKSE